MASTEKELVELLQDRNVNGRYDDIIALALDGQYDDFKSDFATPKIQCVTDLLKHPELQDLAQRVANGDFDD